MDKWWKSPVLQGEDNDYGDYDYMIEEIPRDSRVWYSARDVGPYRCCYCGKERRAFVSYTHYFRTLDGYDSMSEDVCWVCEVESSIEENLKELIQYYKEEIDGINDLIRYMEYEYYFDKEDSLDVFPTYSKTRYAISCGDYMRIDLSLPELKRLRWIYGIKDEREPFHIWDMRLARAVWLEEHCATMIVHKYFVCDVCSQSSPAFTKDDFYNDDDCYYSIEYSRA